MALKKLPPHGEKGLYKKRPLHRIIFLIFQNGRSKRLYTLTPPLLAPMNESNNEMHNILEHYSSNNDIKIHSRMHPRF